MRRTASILVVYMKQDRKFVEIIRQSPASMKSVLQTGNGNSKMIHVIATIQVKEGRLAEFIEIFKSNIPHVLKEAGCIEYMLTVDLLPGLPRQEVNRNSATVIEKWDGVEALQAHLSTPHMAAYREKAKGLVENSSIRILKEA
jgi:quinol monooxygenase YgiN